jgi:hypothetical protein
MTWSIEINAGVVGGAHLVLIEDILDGTNLAKVRIPNTSANRTMVANDYGIDIIYNSITIWDGITYAPQLTKEGEIEITCYKQAYKELAEATLTADYSSGAQANTILGAVATEAGINAGACPTDTIYVEFVGANCLEIVKYLASVLETNHYTSGTDTINIGSRGTSKGAITSYTNNSMHGINRAKVRNHVLLRGYDEDNNRITGEAYWDAGNTVIVKGTPPGGFDKRTYDDEDRQSKTVAMLQDHAADLLEDLRREESGSKIFVNISQGSNLHAGDTIQITDSDLNLTGSSSRIFKVLKKPEGVETHIERLYKETEDYIDDTRKYAALGIHIPPNIDDIVETLPSAPTGFDASDITTSRATTSDGETVVNFIVTIPRVDAATAYGLRWKISANSDWTVVQIDQPSSGNPTYYINKVRAGFTYNFQVASIGKLGSYTAWTPGTPVNKVASTDTSAPATPTGLTATGGFGKIELEWNENAEGDLDHYIVYYNTINDSGSATVIARIRTTFMVYIAQRAEYNQTRYFWIRAADKTGNTSSYSTVASAAATHVESLDVVEGIQPYESDLEFSAYSGDENDSVSWGAGTVQFADGTSQSINSGNARNMSAGVHYIYFTVGSSTLSNTTVYSNVIGNNVGLLALLKVSTDTDQEILIFPFRAKGLNIIADVIAAQAVLATHIKAGAITVNKHYSTPWDSNMIPDNGFESGDHTVEWTNLGGSWTTQSSVVHLGGWAVRANGDGSVLQLESNVRVPCKEGEVWVVSGWHRHDISDVGNSGILLGVYDSNKSYIGWVQNLSGDPGTTWTKRESRYRIANSTYMYLSVRLRVLADMGANEYAWFDDIQLRRIDMQGGSTSQARIEMFPDANTGFIAYDASNNQVFRILVGGTNQGDVEFGDYASNQGILWDRSAATLTIRGTLNADNAVITNLEVDQFKAGQSVQTDNMSSTTILDTTYGSQVQLSSGGYTTLRSAACNSAATSPITLARVTVRVRRASNTTAARSCTVKVDYGSTQMFDEYIHVFDTAGWVHIVRRLVPLNLEGVTITAGARAVEGSGCWVDCKITVDQFEEHAHVVPP